MARNEIIPLGQAPVGGAILMEAINAYVRNNIIAYNSAARSGGIHYWNPYGNVVHPILENNLIFGNTATIYGGGISTHHYYEIINCIIWGNSSPQYGSQRVPVITYSNLEEAYSNGSNNIFLEPELLDTTYFLLSDTSPCIDAGNSDPMYNDVEHIYNLGHPMPPANGMMSNDMGHCGGPNSFWGYWQWPYSIELPSTPILVSPVVGDTITTNQVTFSWEDSDPMVLRYGLELDTIDQFNNYFVDSVVIGNSFEYSGLEVNKNYYWRVRAYNTAGWSEFSEVRTFNTFITSVSENDLLPNVFTLGQNYPNPFNPATKIKYSIPELSFVTIKVYDVLGSEVSLLINEEKSIGTYEITWSAEQLPSGVYFYKLQSGSFVETKKMVLIK